MATFREFNVKLASLRSMRRITRTMRMVAAGHLRRTQEAFAHSTAYRDALRSILAEAAPAAPRPPPPDAPVRTSRNALLLVLSSDRGLCGGFSGRLVEGVADWLEANRGRWRILRAAFWGRKAWRALRTRVETRGHYPGLPSPPEFDDAVRIGIEIDELFKSGKYAEIHLAYTRFRNVTAQEVTVERLLPFVPPAHAPERPRAGTTDLREKVYEPSREILAERLVMQCVRFHIYQAMLQSAASEHGARMMAMESATSNIDKLSAQYTLLRNTARQAAITRELNEIVSGAEALKA